MARPKRATLEKLVRYWRVRCGVHTLLVIAADADQAADQALREICADGGEVTLSELMGVADLTPCDEDDEIMLSTRAVMHRIDIAYNLVDGE